MKIFKRIFRIFTENIIVKNEQLPPIFETNNTIMSFNIRVDKSSDNENNWIFRRRAILKMITDTKPSIICMQEVMPHMFKYLKNNLNSTYDCVSVDRYNNKSLDKNLHWFGGGMCIFYDKDKYEYIHKEVFDFPTSEDGESIKKNCLILYLIDKIEHKPIKIINTHLDVKSKQVREKSIKLLNNEIDNCTYLCGDFNCTINSSEFKPLLLYNISSSLNSDQRTFNHFDNTHAILDFIITKNKINNYSVVTEGYSVPYISDHYPILIDICLEVKSSVELENDEFDYGHNVNYNSEE